MKKEEYENKNIKGIKNNMLQKHILFISLQPHSKIRLSGRL